MTRIWLTLCIALPSLAAEPGNIPPADALQESPASTQIADLVSAVWTLISEVQRDFPESHDARVLEGMMFQLGNHTQASLAWQQVLNQDPQHVEVLDGGQDRHVYGNSSRSVHHPNRGRAKQAHQVYPPMRGHRNGD